MWYRFVIQLIKLLNFTIMKKLFFIAFLMLSVGAVSAQSNFHYVYWSDFTTGPIHVNGETNFQLPRAGATYTISYTPTEEYSSTSSGLYYLESKFRESLAGVSHLVEIQNINTYAGTITLKFKSRDTTSMYTVAIVGRGWYMEFFHTAAGK